MASAKSIIDMGFNVAIMTAFTDPEGGAVAAAALAGVQAGFDILFDVVFQVPDRVNPLSLTPNRADLKNALNEMEAHVDEDVWKMFQSDHAATLLALNDALSEVWITGSNKAKMLDPRYARGPMYAGPLDNSRLRTWKRQGDNFADAVQDVPAPLMEIIEWVELNTTHKNQTAGMYGLAGSLWLGFCKMGMAWEYNMALREYNTTTLETYNALDQAYHKQHFTWKHSADPKGPEPVAPVKPVMPVFDSAWQNNSIFATLIADHIGSARKPGFIQYLEPIAKTLKANYESREKQLAARRAQFTIVRIGSDYAYKDAKTGTISAAVKYKGLAEGKMKIAQGAAYLALNERLTKEFHLEGAKPGDAETLLKIVEQWKKTQRIIAPL